MENVNLRQALLIREPWVSKILDGQKKWELRGSNTKKRGRIGIISAGTGLIKGHVDLVDCVGPLSMDDLSKSFDKHCVSIDYLKHNLKYKSTYGWVLDAPVLYSDPIPYHHPQGAVIWVNL